jgi:hypothetical protein
MEKPNRALLYQIAAIFKFVKAHANKGVGEGEGEE